MKLTIEKMVYGGAGLGRSEHKAVFVPFTLPGEVVEAELERDKGAFVEARLLRVDAPSVERAVPACSHFSHCGGCQYQHARYASQVAMKRAILAEQLERCGLVGLPEIATHTAAPLGYRNRVRLHVDAATHGVGYYERASHTLLAVEVCPIASPLLQRGLKALQQVAPAQQLGKWVAAVELFADGEDAAMMLSAVLASGSTATGRALELLCAALAERVPELVGGVLFPAVASERERRIGREVKGKKPGRRQGVERAQDSAQAGPVASWRAAEMTYKVGGHGLRVSAGAFFQGNRFLVEKLQRLATEDETGDATGETAWDLYAGVGLFATALAERFAAVTAVEGSPISAQDLRDNLPKGRHRVRATSTLAFLEEQVAAQARPDAVVLDPPRAGLGQEAAALLARVRSRSITYVSCDPASLGRDLRILADAGYTISQLHLVDMFPQTFHLETVARLQLR